MKFIMTNRFITRGAQNEVNVVIAVLMGRVGGVWKTQSGRTPPFSNPSLLPLPPEAVRQKPSMT